MLAALLLLSSRMQPLELHSATSCWLLQRCTLVLCSPGEARLLEPVAPFALTQLESGVGSTKMYIAHAETNSSLFQHQFVPLRDSPVGPFLQKLESGIRRAQSDILEC